MTIERIFTSLASGGAQIEQDRVQLVAGAGIVGDRYFDRRDEPGQNISLVEAEELEAFLTAHGRPYDLSISHRNLVTRGVRLNALVGREFTVGDVRLRGVELCEPCLGFGTALASPELPAPAIVKHFFHRGGLRADVLSSGTIRCGHEVKA
jgi:MOSC domain-containing protein YiiM